MYVKQIVKLNGKNEKQEIEKNRKLLTHEIKNKTDIRVIRVIYLKY